MVAALLLAACGDDDDSAAGGEASASTTETTQQAAGRYGAVKEYLAEHTARLVTETGKLRKGAQRYHDLAEGVDFDYEALLSEHADEVRPIIDQLQSDFRAANPAYEEMEGVVAGVPELARLRRHHRRRRRGERPGERRAVHGEDEGRQGVQPARQLLLHHRDVDLRYGGEVLREGREARPERRREGRVRRGPARRGLPPGGDDRLREDREGAAVLRRGLDARARRRVHRRRRDDADDVRVLRGLEELALRGRLEGDGPGFVGASRLEDIASILGGLVVIYDNIEPQIAEEDPAQAEQTGTALAELLAFVEKVRDEEQRGKRFTAEEAETLGTDAQEQAEAIAGQISQAAGRLGVKLQDG